MQDGQQEKAADVSQQMYHHHHHHHHQQQQQRHVCYSTLAYGTCTLLADWCQID
jgi:hypothetical protein